MHTRRLIVERLEPRTLLSAGPAVGTVAGGSHEPLTALELEAGLSTTVLTLATGEILTLGISLDESMGGVDLGGVTFGLDPDPNDGASLIDGIIANGVYNYGLIDLFGPGNLESPFYRTDAPYSAVLKSGGALDVQILESRFEWAGLVEVDALVDVQIDDGTLKLAGTLTDGKLDQQWALDLEGDLTLRDDFSLTAGSMSATLKTGGEVTADFQAGELVEIALDGVDVDVDIDVAPALQTLKLNGSVQGKYHDGKIDLDGSLNLTEDFTYQQGQVTATLKSGGNVGVEIEQSQFKSAELAGIDVEADIDIDGSALELKGSVNGKVHEDYTIDLDGSLSLVEPFTYERDKVTATLAPGGSVGLKVEQSEFKSAELTGVEVEANIAIDESVLKLEGAVSGKVHEDYTVDLLGSLSVKEDFTKQFGESVTATLKQGGSVDLNVERSEFEWAELTGITVEATIDVGDKDLSLEGAISSGKVHQDYKIDLLGSLTLQNDFTKDFGESVTATLKSGGSVGLKVERSEFKSAELTGVEAEADIVIDDSVLKLEGAVGGKIHEDYTVDLVGSLSVKEDFTKQFGESVTATLKEGGSVGVNVERSEFQWAELTGLTIEATVDVDGQDLSLEGTVGGKVHNDYKIDLDGSLSLVEPFTYERGKVTATLAPGGSVGLKVERSEFKSAELTGVEAEVDIVIDESVLKLEGAVSGKIDEDYTVDLVGSISVREDFTRQFGDSASVTLKAGGALDIKVERSEFKYAELSDVLLLADVAVGQSVLKLAGSVEGKIDESYRVDFTGGLTVAGDFEYQRGRLALRIAEGEDVSLATRADGLLEVGLDGVALEADVMLNVRKTLKLAGFVTDGNIVDGLLDFDAEMDLRSPLVLRSRPTRVVIVSADVELSVDDGVIDQLRLRRPVVEVIPPGHLRKDDKSRFEDSLPDDAWDDLTAAVP